MDLVAEDSPRIIAGDTLVLPIVWALDVGDFERSVCDVVIGDEVTVFLPAVDGGREASRLAQQHLRVALDFGAARLWLLCEDYRRHFWKYKETEGVNDL